MTVADIRRRTGIHARDLVLLNLDNDPGALPTQAHVVVGENTVLLSIGYMKVIVERNACLVFRPNYPIVKTGAATLTSAVAARAASVHRSQIPFELVCIEAVFREVVDTYYRRVQILRPILDSFLKSLQDSPMENLAVRQLMPLKDGLNDMDDKVTQVTDMLIQMLNSDEDMAGVLITRKHEFAKSGQSMPLSEHESVELLLETYHRKFTVVRQRIRLLQRQLQNAQDLAAFQLDLYRNRLLTVDIRLAIVNVSFTIHMIVAGFFGMNITHGLETTPFAFWPLVIGTVAMSGGACVYLLARMLNVRAKLGSASATSSEIEALRWVTQNLHVVEHGLRDAFTHKALMKSPDVTREELSKALAESSQRPVTGAEVDLLMSVLDRSKDSILQYYEYEKYLENVDSLSDLAIFHEPPKPK